jgi:hypothetical protein
LLPAHALAGKQVVLGAVGSPAATPGDDDAGLRRLIETKGASALSSFIRATSDDFAGRRMLAPRLAAQVREIADAFAGSPDAVRSGYRAVAPCAQHPLRAVSA